MLGDLALKYEFEIDGQPCDRSAYKVHLRGLLSPVTALRAEKEADIANLKSQASKRMEQVYNLTNKLSAALTEKDELAHKLSTVLTQKTVLVQEVAAAAATKQFSQEATR